MSFTISPDTYEVTTTLDEEWHFVTLTIEGHGPDDVDDIQFARPSDGFESNISFSKTPISETSFSVGLPSMLLPPGTYDVNLRHYADEDPIVLDTLENGLTVTGTLELPNITSFELTSTDPVPINDLFGSTRPTAHIEGENLANPFFYMMLMKDYDPEAEIQLDNDGYAIYPAYIWANFIGNMDQDPTQADIEMQANYDLNYPIVDAGLYSLYTFRRDEYLAPDALPVPIQVVPNVLEVVGVYSPPRNATIGSQWSWEKTGADMGFFGSDGRPVGEWWSWAKTPTELGLFPGKFGAIPDDEPIGRHWNWNTDAPSD